VQMPPCSALCNKQLFSGCPHVQQMLAANQPLLTMSIKHETQSNIRRYKQLEPQQIPCHPFRRGLLPRLSKECHSSAVWCAAVYDAHYLDEWHMPCTCMCKPQVIPALFISEQDCFGIALYPSLQFSVAVHLCYHSSLHKLCQVGNTGNSAHYKLVLSGSVKPFVTFQV
jgi:hypothetical protein